jgi:hypothetical protein
MRVSPARFSSFSVLNPQTKQFGDVQRLAVHEVGIPNVIIWGGAGVVDIIIIIIIIEFLTSQL